jgi:hypothetical protein
MTTIMSAAVSTDELGLDETLATVPGAELELVPRISSQSDVTSLVWGNAESPDRLTAELEADPTTRATSATAVATRVSTPVSRKSWS